MIRFDYKQQKPIEVDEKCEIDVDYVMESTKMNINSKIIKAEHEIRQDEKNLEYEKQRYPLDVFAIAELMSDIKLHKELLENMKTLKNELFKD